MTDFIDTNVLQALLESLVAKSETLPPKRAEIVGKIRSAFHHGNLVLVLGAGVSLDHGLLSWSGLLQELLIATMKESSSRDSGASSVLAALFNSVFKPTPLIAARYLENFYRQTYPDDPLAFVKAVRESLYSKFDPEKRSELLRQITQLCIAPGKTPTLRAIITYNFDDLLEGDLEQSGIRILFRTIYAPGSHAREDELAIYHVHGFLPQKGELTAANRIILSEDYYHQQYSNVYDWSNLIQINTYAEANCLFLGTSLSDPNQRRLLDIARKLRGDLALHHYCIKRRHNPEQVKVTLAAVLRDNQQLLDEKVAADLDFDETVRRLIRVIENYEEKDAASFGIGIVWVKEYAEAADVLKEIQRRIEESA